MPTMLYPLAIGLLALVQQAFAFPRSPLLYANGAEYGGPTATAAVGWAAGTAAVSPGNGTRLGNTIDQEAHAADCIYAEQNMPLTAVECLSEVIDNQVHYTIKATGTGQEPNGWAQGIKDNLGSGNDCWINFGTFNWDTNDETVVRYVVDDWSRRIIRLRGIVLTFRFDIGYKACHPEVAAAIKASLCPNVQVANGLACRKKGYFGDDYSPAGSPTYGHPVVGIYDDIDKGPDI